MRESLAGDVDSNNMLASDRQKDIKKKKKKVGGEHRLSEYG